MGYIFRYSDRFSPLLAELAGTFILVLVGTSVLTALNLHAQGQTPFIILFNTLAFSLTLILLIYTLGRLQPIQLNPAITVLSYLSNRLGLGTALGMIVCQLLGALLASITVGLFYGNAGVAAGLGATYPMISGGPIAALIAEILGSFLFIGLVHYALVRQKGPTAQALLTGLGFAVASLLATGISGAALNPARAIAPQLAAGDITAWWVYICGPLAAALILAVFSRQPASTSQTDERLSDDLMYQPSPEMNFLPLFTDQADTIDDQEPLAPPSLATSDMEQPATNQQSPIQPTISFSNFSTANQPTQNPQPTAETNQPQPQTSTRPEGLTFTNFGQDQPVNQQAAAQPASPAETPQPAPANPQRLTFINYEERPQDR